MIIQEQEAEVEYLIEIYNNFLLSKGVKIESISSIFEFLEQNKISLSRYFAGNNLLEPEIDYHIQAEFVNSVRMNKRIFSILKKVYLGSIISSYLTIDEQGIKTDLEFLIDTNFIIGLLDLGSIEENHTCKKIVEISNNLGCKLSVLDFTIEETQALLNRTADDFENSFLPKKIDPQSIYNACDRKNISKTDLQGIANDLTINLLKEFNIKLIPNTTKLRNIAKFSKDYSFYKKIRSSKYSALHDATAVIYVKEKRGKNVTDFNNSKCWFVTNTSHRLKLNIKSGQLPEIIRADNLINILWLTVPGINVSDVVNIGLSKLISCAISNSLPNIRTLKELDANMQKYSHQGVKPEDVVRVATAVANKTIINLEELNKLAKSNPDEFVKQIHDISESVDKEQSELQSRVNTFIEELASNTEIKISKKINEVKESYKDKVNKLEASKNKETENEIYTRLKPTLDVLKRKSVRRATFLMLLFTAVPLILILVAYYFIEKEKFETIIFPLSLLPAIFSYLFFGVFKKQYSPNVIFDFLKEKQMKKLYKAYSFDYEYFEKLENQFKKES